MAFCGLGDAVPKKTFLTGTQFSCWILSPEYCTTLLLKSVLTPTEIFGPTLDQLLKILKEAEVR